MCEVHACRPANGGRGPAGGPSARTPRLALPQLTVSHDPLWRSDQDPVLKRPRRQSGARHARTTQPISSRSTPRSRRRRRVRCIKRQAQRQTWIHESETGDGSTGSHMWIGGGAEPEKLTKIGTAIIRHRPSCQTRLCRKRGVGVWLPAVRSLTVELPCPCAWASLMP